MNSSVRANGPPAASASASPRVVPSSRIDAAYTVEAMVASSRAMCSHSGERPEARIARRSGPPPGSIRSASATPCTTMMTSVESSRCKNAE